MIRKSEVISFFGGTQKDVANALSIKQPSVSNWSDILTLSQENRVISTCVKRGIEIPKSWLKSSE